MMFGFTSAKAVETWTFIRARSARALVEAEADLENEEKLGEAAMQFFYANKVPFLFAGGKPFNCNEDRN